MEAASGTEIGRGMVIVGEGFAGPAVRADAVADVLALLEEGVKGRVLLTDQASATAIAPILPDLAGVVCTKGGPSAHLAIVSRAMGLPCVMQAEFDEEIEPGTQVRVDAEGRIWR